MITMIRKRLGHIRDVNITRQRYNLAHDFPWNCVSTMSFMKWLIGLRYERNKMYASSIFYTLHFWEADSTNVIICKTKCKTMIKRSKIVPIDINGISFFINPPSSIALNMLQLEVANWSSYFCSQMWYIIVVCARNLYAETLLHNWSVTLLDLLYPSWKFSVDI